MPSPILDKKAYPNVMLLHGSKGLADKALEIAADLTTSSYNIMQFFPEGKMNMHSIASVKLIVKEALSKPFESDAKILIIHSADRMLDAASNALLKTLEEPLETTHILLLTEDPKLLLKTVLSRTTTVFIGERDAISSEKKEVINLVLSALKNDYSNMHNLIKTFTESIDDLDIIDKKNAESNLIKEVSLVIRDLHLAKSINNAEVLYSLASSLEKDMRRGSSKRDDFFHFLKNELENNSISKIPSLEKLADLLNKVDLALEYNMKFKTALEYLLISL